MTAQASVGNGFSDTVAQAPHFLLHMQLQQREPAITVPESGRSCGYNPSTSCAMMLRWISFEPP